MPTYKLSIPQPCSEDWSAMLPKASGRHCSACVKTVVDFTGMTDKEISDYMHSNPVNVCGRFKSEQLLRITLHIPQQVVYSQTQFNRMFLMALFVAMGTTLFSCTDHKGERKKIDEVVVVDSLSEKLENSAEKEHMVDIDPAPAEVHTATSGEFHTIGIVACEPVTPLPDYVTGDIAIIDTTALPPPPPVPESAKISKER